ncbi:HET, NACHT and WD40 domain protein [Metarhizium robertsii]|uniref:Mitochondrial division protein 1 n=1 Tax=Metarhizium robertsii TaxID=568076 RepID=A0A014N5R0_9HYPO|nr:HET, NACHT and WD40 domain protein [Metarhizium robertsii]
MRLLEILPNGDLRLTQKLLDDAIPQYAILSHTWGDESKEVTFEDIVGGSDRGKAGYKKIKFCGNQATQDGLRYFWVDSCCIKKSSDAELSESLNSMFRWYQRAEKCYVYLSDVSTTRKRKTSGGDTLKTWEQAFRESRWFTRGWTLQELLAPTSVKFFSKEGEELGDKQSLEQEIYEITRIPISALRESKLSRFSTEQKFDWAKNRQTTREEDWAYSLLGIFEISMPVVYGEGRRNAVRRLEKEIDDTSKAKQCLRDLRVTDPRADKVRIEEAKGGLIPDSYRWILENNDFKQWRNGQQSHLLWIKGDPGKGKTMLLCGIIDELKKSIAETHLLSFFYCQATDSRINSATAVLRGLLYLLIDQQPSLIWHIQKQHDLAGKNVFEDTNAWVALSDIFTNVLQDPSLKSTYLIIDALDECTIGLPKLLDVIIRKSPVSPHIKWLVSSRNWPPIGEWLDKARRKVTLRLELNAESISTAVSIYIRHKVRQLAQEKKYDNKTRRAVLDHLSSNANGTFLWVALVCQNLQNIPRGRIRARLNSFPPGLNPLYERMMKQICESEDSELCKRILASISTVYEPITLTELTSLVEMLEESSDDIESLQEIVGLCGSFLTIQKDTIYFVHQSAKDYLLAKASVEIFPLGRRQGHYDIFSRSLVVMSRTLRRNIYSLNALGYGIEQVKPTDSDPLAASRYSCVYWVDHLCDWNPSITNDQVDLKDGGIVDTFLRTKYLYWLEALSLCRSVPKGVLAMGRLEALVQSTRQPNTAPVQRGRARMDYDKASYRRKMERLPTDARGPQRLGQLGHVLARLDPTRIGIVGRDGDKTVKIWDASNGKCLWTLKGHSDSVRLVAFLHDLTRLVSASGDRTVRIWDASSSECLQTLEGRSSSVGTVAFSHDSTLLASAWGGTVKIWDASNGECLRTLEGHSRPVCLVAFSHDSTLLASASEGGTMLDGCSDSVYLVAFSHDSTLLALAWGGTVKIWDASNGECLRTLKGHSDSVCLVAFLHDSTWLVLVLGDGTVRIWDASSSERLQTLEGHSGPVDSVAFWHDLTRLVSASWDGTVRIWDTSSGKCLQMLDGYSSWVNMVAFSHDSTLLVSASQDGTVNIWDASSGECLQTLKGHSNSICLVAFLHNLTRIVSALSNRTVRIWDTSSGECLWTLEGHSSFVNSVAFLHDLIRIVLASWDGTVRIWDAGSGECLKALEGYNECVYMAAFLPDAIRLALASRDGTARIWDASSGECL